MFPQIWVGIFVCSVILLLSYLVAFIPHYIDILSNNEEESEEEEEEKEEPLDNFNKIPNMCLGQAYYINDVGYTGIFICDHVYMCNTDFYPSGMELHITIINGTNFGSRLVFCVHKSKQIKPVEISDYSRQLLKLIRG